VRYASRMGRLKKENAFVVLEKAQEMERQGRDIIHLEIGDTDFTTPATIIAETHRQLLAGRTHYCSPAGLTELREACCTFLASDGRGDYQPDEIVVGPGGKSFLFWVITAFAEAGDEVIYPDPGFPVYESVIGYSGATPVPLPILEQNDFRIDTQDLAARITPRTRLLILNYPHNPTGGTLDGDDLAAIADVVIDYDLMVLSDEVYAHMLFDGTHISLATLSGMRERTLTLESFSKTYAMTGWRLGFLAAPAPVATRLAEVIANSISCVAPFIQLAGAQAITGASHESRTMMEAFRQRRDLFVDGLNQIPGISCLRPRGTFYAFPNVSELPLNAEELSDRLLDHAGVATLPGTAFGHGGTGHIRLCFAHDTHTLQDALHRIAATTKELMT
jgi:aspartate aminotransferase